MLLAADNVCLHPVCILCLIRCAAFKIVKSGTLKWTCCLSLNEYMGSITVLRLGHLLFFLFISYLFPLFWNDANLYQQNNFCFRTVNFHKDVQIAFVSSFWATGWGILFAALGMQGIQFSQYIDDKLLSPLCTRYDASALQALERMCLKIEIPTEDVDDYCYRSSAINKIARWFVSRGFLVVAIMLRDNLNETVLEIWRHCDRG